MNNWESDEYLDFDFGYLFFKYDYQKHFLRVYIKEEY